MGNTLWRGALWTPYAEGVNAEERAIIASQMKVRLDTLNLRAGVFDGYVAIELPIFYHSTSRVLTVACEQVDRYLPVTVCCVTWKFQYIDVDVVAFQPKRWWFIDTRTGLKVQDGGQ